MMVKIRRLIWDDRNVKHISKHKVCVDEVEEVCQLATEVLETYKGRLAVLGKTKRGRLLTTVLAPEGKGEYYVVTARDMSKKERRFFLK